MRASPRMLQSPLSVEKHEVDMLRDLAIVGCILCASRVVLWVINRFDRRAGGAEFSRKMLHVAMGLLLCPLPWLFDRFWPVGLLCLTYVALLIARRYLAALDNHVAGVIDGVGRKSVGEFLFPITVALLFALAGSDRVAYLAPMLILTFSDAAAAVIGRRYGMCPYPAPGGCKSIEGSLAFAITAFALAHLSLLFMGSTGRLESVLLAIVIALTLTVVEAFVTGGWDNLLVPVGGWALLKTFTHSSSATLALLAAGAMMGVLALIVLYSLVPSLSIGRTDRSWQRT
jgi:phytol kinase